MTFSAEHLRKRAAALLEETRDGRSVSEDHVARLVEETLMLQTELAIQQDELTESHRRLETLTEHYQQLFESAPIGFVRISDSSNVEDINVAARVLLGVDVRWRLMAPLLFTTFLPATSLQSWRELTRSSGGLTRTAIIGARGTFLADVRTVPWRGPGDGWLVVIADVSEVSEARARQLEAEERFGQIVQQMTDGLVVIDSTTGLIAEHNEAFSTILGRGGESLVGHAHEDFFSAELRAIQVVMLKQALRERRSHATIRYDHVDGDARVTDVTIGAVQSGVGGLEYLVVRDITARHRAEEERRRVEARIAETQKLEALGLLAAGVAHDMNNLLTAVLAATEIPPTEETLSDLRAVALRGRELTERLLAVSRRKPLRIEAFDLLGVVDEVIGLARRTFPREIAIDFDRPLDGWNIEGDPGQWHQALLNLLINARDAIAGQGRILVSTDAASGKRALLVQDTGTGMAPEVLRRAFEPFFSTKAEGRGTGLGLAHVRAVATAHGGSVTLDSVPGRGTTVRLGIKTVATAVVRTKSVAPPVASADAPTRTVLVVDDEPFVSKATARLLSRLGWTPTIASSVSEALQALETQTFDLVVTDRSMPELTGDQLCRAIRCRWPSLPVAIMTGLADDQSVTMLRQMGAFAVLGKPFRMDELFALLESARDAGPVPTDLVSCDLPEHVCPCKTGCTRRSSYAPPR
ncbi:MAG: response regulator [Polyangiaceae bacterium]